MDPQAETEPPVSLERAGCLDVTASLDTPESREKREILETWVVLEQWDKRETEESRDYLGLPESLVWPDFLDPWDQWVPQDPLGPPDQEDPGLDLTIWKDLEVLDSLD